MNQTARAGAGTAGHPKRILSSLGIRPFNLSYTGRGLILSLPIVKAMVLADNVFYVALYVPFIPLAEAFGVPKENIVWGDEHLTVGR